MYIFVLSCQERKNGWFLNPCVMCKFEAMCRSLRETVLFPFVFSKFISERCLLEKLCALCGLIQVT